MISNERATAAVLYLAAMIAFFPRDEDDQTAIGLELQRMVDSDEKLAWLVRAAANSIPKWTGFAAIRGVYCSRFTPADGGPEVVCDIPGFRPSDIEADFFKSESEATARKLDSWRRDKLLNPAKYEPLALPGEVIKQLPALEAAKQAALSQKSQSRTERDVALLRSGARLADTARVPAAGIRIPATPKRTPEEAAALEQQLAEQLKSKNTKGQTK